MKSVVAVVCALASIALVSGNAPAELLAKIPAMLEECKAKTGATDEVLGGMLNHEVPSKKEAQCFVACMKKTIGVMTPDNKMNLPKIHEFMDMMKKDSPDLYEKMNKMVDACSKEVVPDADECVAATQLMECGKKHAEELGIMEDLAMISK